VITIPPYTGFIGPAGAGGAPFDAGDFDATMWVSGDQSSLSGLANNDPVDHWVDRVTGTRRWAGNSTARPLFKTGGPNGLPYLQFDAINDAMDYNLGGIPVAASSIMTAGAYTIVAVVRPQTDGNQNGTEFGKNIFSPAGYVGLCLFDADAGAGVTNKFRIYRFNGGYIGVDSTTTYLLNTWYIVIAWWDGTNLNIRVNKDTLTSVAASNPQQLSDPPQLSWVTPMGADIAEMFTKDEAPIDTAEVDDIFDGLAAKYALTIP
jgi:hypothetical protein